ncbi:MAG: hypothetical protein ACKVP7_25055 [Hyphomicrobiaceae bacterium]
MPNSDKPDLRVVATDGLIKSEADVAETPQTVKFSPEHAEPKVTPKEGAKDGGSKRADAKPGSTTGASPAGGPSSGSVGNTKPFDLAEVERALAAAKGQSTAAAGDATRGASESAALPPPVTGASPPPNKGIDDPLPLLNGRDGAGGATRKVTRGYDDPLPSRPAQLTKPTRLGPAPDDANHYNYIFTVGRPGSGKTTFQSHLLRYLNSGGDHTLDADPGLSRANVDFRDMFLEWQDQWDRGQFPRRSEVGRPLDFRYIVSPNTDGFPPLPFGFLEISGEDFIQLAKKSKGGKPPELLKSIDEFLNNPRLNIAFLFVCQGQDLKGDDLLFSQFLQYLKDKIGRGFESHCSAVLVIADPETCQERLAHKLGTPDIANETLDIDRFIKHFLPASAAKLARWKHRATIATFSVGTIVDDSDETGQPIKLITEPSFEDAKLIYDWLYHRFTDRRIGVEEGFAPKVREWLRKLALLGGGVR